MLIEVNQLGALLSVVIIDVVLAGDNAIVVGMAASGLPAEQRRRVILLGIAVATVLRILFAYFAAQLLVIIGLTLAGGILLLWVSWKMYREIRATPTDNKPLTVEGGVPTAGPRKRAQRGRWGRLSWPIVSMSLDNVLAVAGTARDHSLGIGLRAGLSVALMGVASTYIARLLERYFWISWVGLGIITFVALQMIWDGSTEVIQQTSSAGLSGL